MTNEVRVKFLLLFLHLHFLKLQWEIVFAASLHVALQHVMCNKPHGDKE
jgi:hypothetical protein